MAVNKPWLNQLLIILEAHLSNEDLDNQFIANLMDISERQFYRKVKSLTGESPNLYIRKYRLAKAKSYIQDGDFLTVQEIALAVGYQNLHYFSKAFEKAYEITPMQLLKKLGHR